MRNYNKKTKTLGKRVNLVKESATSLTSLLTQQKQQHLNDLLTTKILLFTLEITHNS